MVRAVRRRMAYISDSVGFIGYYCGTSSTKSHLRRKTEMDAQFCRYENSNCIKFTEKNVILHFKFPSYEIHGITRRELQEN